MTNSLKIAAAAFCIMQFTVFQSIGQTNAPADKSGVADFDKYVQSVTVPEKKLLAEILSFCRDALYSPSANASAKCVGRVQGWKDRFAPANKLGDGIQKHLHDMLFDVTYAQIAETNGVKLEDAAQQRKSAHNILDSLEAALSKK